MPEDTWDQRLPSDVSARNTAYVIYTSGSTGKPKGVLVEHQSLVNYLYWVKDSLLHHAGEMLPFLTELTFDASIKQLFKPLICGETVWVIPREIIKQPDELLRVLATQSYVSLNCVPSLWATLLEMAAQGDTMQYIKTLFLGGERLSNELVRRTHAFLPHLPICNLYGPTEITVNASYAPEVHEDAVFIGRPLANTRIYVLDQHLQPVPIGVTGEIYVGGAGVTRGYLGRADLTAERFVPDSFGSCAGERLYRTGDLARYTTDGQLDFVGRVDHQVKVRGFRIELGEIEQVLADHPAVQECLVLLREDRPGEQSLVAYVQMLPSNEQATFSVAELRSYLQSKLPEYMVPTFFVVLDAFPLTSHGKVDRRALPPPDRLKPERSNNFVAPCSPAEKVIAAIWTALLGLEQVGIHDNFFTIGGHSLLAKQIVSQIRQTFQVELPLRRLFETPTIDGIIHEIAQILGSRDLVDEVALIVMEVEQLSEEDVQEILLT